MYRLRVKIYGFLSFSVSEKEKKRLKLVNKPEEVSRPLYILTTPPGAWITGERQRLTICAIGSNEGGGG